MMQYLIKNATIINENKIFKGSVLIDNEKIKEIYTHDVPNFILTNSTIIHAEDSYLIPGIIDSHVHFREPGLTHKGDIYSESKAAVAGGVTSFIDMPNVVPPTITNDLLKQKWIIAKEKSLINYSFLLGATNDNIEEIISYDNKKVCGVKVFLGSSTGNMTVNDEKVLRKIFSQKNLLVAVHCEDDKIIQKNLSYYRKKYKTIPTRLHEKIRSTDACYKSSSLAIKLAKKYNTRLHILHLSTAKEIELLNNVENLHNKQITAEVCVHHLFFDNRDYKKLGNKIRWNPSIKSEKDKNSLIKALIENKIDIISTDHAPHTIEEKEKPYSEASSGGPLVGHSLMMMLKLYENGEFSLQKIVEKMCHAPVILFNIRNRGYIRKGYNADLCLFRKETWTVQKSNLLYKCGWSPLENYEFNYKVLKTFVNGKLIYDNGKFNENSRGMQLEFCRNFD